METRAIIQKKRDGFELSGDELEHMILGYLAGDVPDYQMSAWLMAVLLLGMSEEETHEMTSLMMYSGRVLTPADLPSPSADKHSTGGVGDKVSLALAPLVASAGVCVPMLSGRGLGHTGGTLDKLESVPGLRTDLGIDRFIDQVETVGCCIASQSGEMTPADGAIYALRDVTGTVESLPLIVSSIVGKKVAEGAGAIVYDVKWGGGAFMKDMESAVELATRLVAETERFDRKAMAFVTDMNQPLGMAVGNSLEMIEAIDLLSGDGPDDLREITVLLGAAMLYLAGAVGSLEAGVDTLSVSISAGSARAKLEEMIHAQGGDGGVVYDTTMFPVSSETIDITSEAGGYVHSIDARGLGALVCEMGGGRKTVEDEIDHGVGALLHKKEGDRVAPAEPLATLFVPSGSDGSSLRERVGALLQISSDMPERRPLAPLIVTARGPQKWGGEGPGLP
jgi:pyrimidine-nucleoside phosphorylase